jgi:catalase
MEANGKSRLYHPCLLNQGDKFDQLADFHIQSYDDTSTHRHNSPNGYLLPINRAIAPINNNYRDGYMQPYIYEGDSISVPNGIGGVQEPGQNATLAYTTNGESAGSGPIGRYVVV